MTDELAEKLGNMAPNMTVAELISRLAGLPPMMEVLAFKLPNLDPLFLNEIEVVEGTDKRAPYLTILVSTYPKQRELDHSSYEERIDRQRQRAMHMGSESEQATKMHPMVE